MLYVKIIKVFCKNSLFCKMNFTFIYYYTKMPKKRGKNHAFFPTATCQRRRNAIVPLSPTFSEKSFTNILMWSSITFRSSICASRSINGVTKLALSFAIAMLLRISDSTSRTISSEKVRRITEIPNGIGEFVFSSQ